VHKHTSKDNNGTHGPLNHHALPSTNNFLQVTLDNTNYMCFQDFIILCLVLLAKLKVSVTLKHLMKAINMPLYFITWRSQICASWYNYENNQQDATM